jgi:nitroreductase
LSKPPTAPLPRAACEQGFVLVAPVSLVFCANTARNEERFGARARFMALEDATIACTYAQLQAADLGLGTCWVGAFDPDAVRRVIHAAKGLEPVAILPIGHPKGEAEVKDRRPIADLVHNV